MRSRARNSADYRKCLPNWAAPSNPVGNQRSTILIGGPSLSLRRVVSEILCESQEVHKQDVPL
ncbi:EspF repeat-containing protein [Bradyrhizobium nanningense]|uniref:EspF repeat-containing protein n=1 Tax=Bradyrhizobium nanningense TaxID=1325118 RepID=UPI001009012B